MNYAWANPTTGFREQSEDYAFSEARYRVWQELQSVDPPAAGASPECQIWRQEPIGHVSIDGPEVDAGAVAKLNAEDPDYQFAWAHRETGVRIVADHFPSDEILDVLKRVQASGDLSTLDVIVYATWPEYVVRRSDPEPEEDKPNPYTGLHEGEGDPRAGDAPDITAQRAALDEVIVLDDQTKVGKVTAWALLDIASTIRESASDFRYPARGPTRTRRNPRRAHRRRLGLWERFRLWVWGDPKEDDPIKRYESAYGRKSCRSCGESMADGSPLICPKCAQEILDKYLREGQEYREGQRYGGTPRNNSFDPNDLLNTYGPAGDQAEKRAAAVASRGPAPVDGNSPHVYVYPPNASGTACFVTGCGRPMRDAIHGYTGD